MGIGRGQGKTRAVDAAVAAISSPLLDFPGEASSRVFELICCYLEAPFSGHG